MVTVANAEPPGRIVIPMDLERWHRWYKHRGRRELRTILMEEWDPIGVHGIPQAADEYDGYVAHVAGLLREGASLDDLSRVLSAYRTSNMGLLADPVTDRRAAASLTDWYSSAMADEARADAESASTDIRER